MEQLKIFENEEFGQIRTVMRDGEVWFVGKDVAEALGYGKGKSLANAVSDHVDPEDKGVTKMMTPGGNQKVTIINESGLYSLILSSKLESAKRFKRWVTSEVLPAIRKTGSYDMDEYSPEMKAILMHDKKLVKIDNRVTDLENHMTIDYGQQTVLGDEVNKAVLDALGGKYSNAYNEIGKKVFAECNTEPAEEEKLMDVQIGKYKMGDFGLKLLGVDLGTPSVRKSTVTIPGRNGALDLTEAITGFPVYDNATHKLTFDFKDGTYSTWLSKASDIRGKLHGRRLPVIFGDDGYYYDARVSVDSSKLNQHYSQIVVTLDAEPYKLARKTSLDDWEWDRFNFETDIIRDYKNIPVPGEITVVGDVMPTGCVFEASAAVTVTYDGKSYQIPKGHSTVPDILITEGIHTMQFKGDGGTVSVEYRGGRF